MAIPLIGFPAPSTSGSTVGIDLITGDSRTLAGGLGGWASFGSHQTITIESGGNKGYPGTDAASLPNVKIVSTQGDGADGDLLPASGAKLTVAPAGGFKAGRLYQVEMFVAYDGDPVPNSSFMNVGLDPSIGVNVGQMLVQAWQSSVFGGPGYVSGGPYPWMRYSVTWRPTVDVASVDLKVGRTDSSVTAQTFHISGGLFGPRMFEVYGPSPFTPWASVPASYGPHANFWLTGDFSLRHSEWNGGTGFWGSGFFLTQEGVSMNGGHRGGTVSAGEFSAGPGQIFIGAPHTPVGDLISNTITGGIDIDVGEDYVGFYISEKDATTVQIYDDAGGAYDIEFVEQDPTFHFRFVHPSGGVAIPALGMLPRYAAAPHAGVEQEGESYYDTVLHKTRTWDGTAWQNHW